MTRSIVLLEYVGNAHGRAGSSNRNTLENSRKLPEEDYTLPFGVANVKRQGKDVTIVAVSLMVHHALAVAETAGGWQGTVILDI